MSNNTQNTQNDQNDPNDPNKVVVKQPSPKVITAKQEKEEPKTPICGHCGRYGADGVINYYGTTFTIHQRCVSNFRDSI